MEELIERLSNINEFDFKKAFTTAAATAILTGAAFASDANSTKQQSAPTSTTTLKAEKSLINMDRIIKIESNNNPKAVSKVGARGLCQIMKPTWIEIVKKMGEDWSWDSAFDSDKNKAVGTYYYNVEIPRLLKAYKIPVTTETILAVYNWGIGNLNKAYKKYGDKWKDAAPKETKGYINKYLLKESIKEVKVTNNLTPDEVDVIKRMVGA